MLVVGCGGHSGGGPTPQEVLTADVGAKADARTAATAMEVYATDGGGSYEGATVNALRQIEPKIPRSVEVKAGVDTYALTIRSPLGGNTFNVARLPSGQFERRCATAGSGGCPASGRW